MADKNTLNEQINELRRAVIILGIIVFADIVFDVVSWLLHTGIAWR